MSIQRTQNELGLIFDGGGHKDRWAGIDVIRVDYVKFPKNAKNVK